MPFPQDQPQCCHLTAQPASQNTSMQHGQQGNCAAFQNRARQAAMPSRKQPASQHRMPARTRPCSTACQPENGQPGSCAAFHNRARQAALPSRKRPASQHCMPARKRPAFGHSLISLSSTADTYDSQVRLAHSSYGQSLHPVRLY